MMDWRTLMASILNFGRKKPAAPAQEGDVLARFLDGFSIEVMPRTAAKVEDFRAILPAGTRVYIAHIEGTPIADMVATARRLRDEGFEPMPHFPARIIHDKPVLTDWVARYKGEAGIRQALLLGGGVTTPAGDYDNAMQLLESGAFDGFERLHVAGHPEGNRDIDPDGSDRMVMQALHWKHAFAQRSDAKMAIATQFCFEADPVIAWVNRLAAEGIDLPVHIGIAGPAKLQTMIKFAMTCGVGPSLRVLQRRAADLTNLILPFEPTEILSDLAAHKAANPGFGIAHVHFFPIGGITATSDFIRNATSPQGLQVRA
jgi:methylenetetrahydrofolate reductase (NADPH)